MMAARLSSPLLLLAWGLGVPVEAGAQGAERPRRFADADAWIQEANQTQEQEDGGLTFAGTAKWASLAISAGAAVYGFSLNSQADDSFAQLEDICAEEPERCESRNPDGSFRDEELEGLYQETLSKDRQARTALVASQVTLAAAVVLFIIDLSNRPPENVPYDPPVTLELGSLPDGRFALGARVRLGRLRAP